MPRTGRPPKPENERRDKDLLVRLTKDELQECKNAAGSTSLSTWGREHILAAARHENAPTRDQ